MKQSCVVNENKEVCQRSSGLNNAARVVFLFPAGSAVGSFFKGEV